MLEFFNGFPKSGKAKNENRMMKKQAIHQPFFIILFSPISSYPLLSYPLLSSLILSHPLLSSLILS